ncbi:serine threonine- phosphatase 2A activator 1 [Pyrenophora seminiperda CCB06]|uniref:Serine/threonine-protein phosphatase 2A activator n=1 Tax=Pyrenophora seminiperda CCB06 TaxID=1302712 RepID=A0A3M7M1P4_9PLEO|nr:serine threonine- phosphatase 2A activator 1 [Pyrenophora seminiperda CCB06]
MALSNSHNAPVLDRIDKDAGHDFQLPVKRIHDGDDVTFFLGSRAYADIMTFIFQLNTAMIPRKITNNDKDNDNNQESETSATNITFKEFPLNDPSSTTPNLPIIQSLATLLSTLSTTITEAPPDPGPRRFGNVSFRTWHALISDRIPDLLDQHLPASVLSFKSTTTTTTSSVSAKDELSAYLVGSFGSAQRLDYGTGHELSFLAFLAALWKLGAFPDSADGEVERGIVLGVVEPYLALVRRLILTYTLEPAGSHGVWGLDDHSFLPYIFGSAQFSPPIAEPGDVKAEGSLPSAPHPGDVAKASAVERERHRNMYFSAIGFIYDVKKGPFWEHSNILYDVSGVKAGWAKINKVSFFLNTRKVTPDILTKYGIQGMIKMYNAEVLSKFPVVQHFPFGSLFPFTPDPAAKQIQATVHTASQPKASSSSSSSSSSSTTTQPPLRDALADSSAPATTRPLPPSQQQGNATTAAPWAGKNTLRQSHPPGSVLGPRIPGTTTAQGPNVPSGPDQPTKAPWASRTPAPPPPPPGSGTVAPWAKRGGTGGDVQPSTRAPWADKR